MAFWRLVGWDLKLLWRSGAAGATVAAVLLAAALASWTGLGAQSQHQRSVLELGAAAVAAGEGLASPHAVRMRIVLGAPPLADFAVGRTGLDPIAGDVTPITPLHRIFENYQLDNPWTLASARFDFAFLSALVIPLVLTALCAGVFSEDQRTGRHVHLIAHGARAEDLLLARVTARTLLTAAPLAAALAGQLALGGGAGDGRGLSFALFLASAGLGLAFWAGLAVTVNALRLPPAHTVAALFSAWAVLAVVAPAVLSAAAQSAAPAPNRLAFLADARAAEIVAVQAAAALRRAYLNDHPELEPGGFDVPDWAKARFVVAGAIDAESAPVRAEFAEALARQAAIASAWQWVSPSIAQHLAFSSAAGVDADAALDAHAQARAKTAEFRDRFGPMIMAGAGVAEADVRPWRVVEIPNRPTASAGSLAALAAWALAAWLAAGWSLHRRRAMPAA
jgi:hypothetical protein